VRNLKNQFLGDLYKGYIFDLKSLLTKLEAGFYAVPETQRYFVWANSQIRDLAISIYNWYPIGGIIVWEMPNSFIDDYGALMRPLALGLLEKNMKYMVIDGQQRLTSPPPHQEGEHTRNWSAW
jgi:uncharacterized protein with ParB-like and HNH nuclease domain